jgi:hypothetical protein
MVDQDHLVLCGPDNLYPRLLKELSSEIAPLLQLVYQKSLDTSCVPEDWRKANVTPIYKKGPKYLAENYRRSAVSHRICSSGNRAVAGIGCHYPLRVA